MKNLKATSTPFESISTSNVPFGRFVSDRDILCSGWRVSALVMGLALREAGEAFA
jgi:hypothetical protein